MSFGVVVYAAVTKELGSAVLFSTLVTIAIFIVWLLLRLQKVEVERDRALAWSRESEWRASQQKVFQISQTGPESAMHLQQLLDLQREIAAMRAREAVLEKQAYYDELTKLPNRALLRLRFRSAIERSQRNNRPFAVLMLDLNEFKAVNDKYGHEIGDFVLVTTANRISGALTSADTAARLGGDEFVIVIQSATMSEDF
ncbi:MAG: GGDEF domain-containing protein, partial [Rhodoferax sp.]